jgi:MFS family permease
MSHQQLEPGPPASAEAAELVVAAGSTRWPEALRALRHPNFRTYWFGQVISLIGTWMQRTAQLWLVYRLTGSALNLGMVAAATFAPFLLFSPLAGLVIDRVDRRRLVIAAQVGFMVLGVVQAGLTLSGRIQFWHVVVLAFGLGLAETFEVPGRLSLIGRVVPREDLLNAIALHSSAFNAARIIGPAVAGLVLARLSEGVVFASDAASYIPVIIGLWRMRLAPGEVIVVPGGALADLRDGLRHALGNPRVRILTAIVAAQGLLGLPYVSVVPVFAGAVLQAGPRGLGWLTAATGVGALAGSIAVMALGDLPRRGRLLVIGMLGFAAALAMFAVSRSLPLSLLALTALGWSQVTHLTTSNTLVQLAVPDSLRGRVLSLYIWLHGGTLPVGSLLLGAAGQQWGAPRALLVSALLYGLLLLIALQRRPDLFHWE